MYRVKDAVWPVGVHLLNLYYINSFSIIRYLIVDYLKQKELGK